MYVHQVVGLGYYYALTKCSNRGNDEMRFTCHLVSCLVVLQEPFGVLMSPSILERGRVGFHITWLLTPCAPLDTPLRQKRTRLTRLSGYTRPPISPQSFLFPPPWAHSFVKLHEGGGNSEGPRLVYPSLLVPHYCCLPSL